jgi:transposase
MAMAAIRSPKPRGPRPRREAGPSRSLNARLPVLPKRWIVERTFAGLSRFRRLARDFERYARDPHHAEAARCKCLVMNLNFSRD